MEFLYQRYLTKLSKFNSIKASMMEHKYCMIEGPTYFYDSSWSLLRRLALCSSHSFKRAKKQTQIFIKK